MLKKEATLGGSRERLEPPVLWQSKSSAERGSEPPLHECGKRGEARTTRKTNKKTSYFHYVGSDFQVDQNTMLAHTREKKRVSLTFPGVPAPGVEGEVRVEPDGRLQWRCPRKNVRTADYLEYVFQATQCRVRAYSKKSTNRKNPVANHWGTKNVWQRKGRLTFYH